MRIRNIKIENFRSIDSINFDVESNNIIIGKNNEGKTNIFRALNIFWNDIKDIPWLNTKVLKEGVPSINLTPFEDFPKNCIN